MRVVLLREWWANGPLGLEQGFDIARPSGGVGGVGAVARCVRESAARPRDGTAPGGFALCRPAGHRCSWSQFARLAAGAWRTRPRAGQRSWRALSGADRPVRGAGRAGTLSDGVGCNGDCSDRFGYSVATSGNTVVVGSPFSRSELAGRTAVTVYVFLGAVPAGWASATQTAELAGRNLGGLTWSWVTRSPSRATATRSSPVRPRAAR